VVSRVSGEPVGGTRPTSTRHQDYSRVRKLSRVHRPVGHGSLGLRFDSVRHAERVVRGPRDRDRSAVASHESRFCQGSRRFGSERSAWHVHCPTRHQAGRMKSRPTQPSLPLSGVASTPAQSPWSERSDPHGPERFAFQAPAGFAAVAPRPGESARSWNGADARERCDHRDLFGLDVAAERQ